MAIYAKTLYSMQVERSEIELRNKHNKAENIRFNKEYKTAKSKNKALTKILFHNIFKYKPFIFNKSDMKPLTFGGKANYTKRSIQQISHDDFVNMATFPLVAYGDALKKDVGILDY